MIPNNLIVSEVESTMQGERLQMGVREEDMPHLMGILSGIYSDPTRAVAREYITNALDSHTEAGQTRPVEVTTPSLWQPNLIIKDFGVGMDSDDIRRIFKFYGASTKRDNSVATGMLGIGSKSAFAYSNSFTVTAVKNGVRTVAAMSRDEVGAGAVDIVDVTETSDGNGVTITVPVTNQVQMKNAVVETAKYLPVGVLLVDGEDLSQRDNWFLIGSNIKDDTGKVVILNLWKSEEPRTYNDPSRVIMGNVAYQPTDRISPPGWNKNTIYAEVAMGAVVFEPSRESLMDVHLTKKTEAVILKNAESLIVKSVSDTIAKADDHTDALILMNEHSDALRGIDNNGISYKGKKIPRMHDEVMAHVEGEPYRELLYRTYQPFASGRKAGNARYATYRNFLCGNRQYVILNAPDKTFTTVQRRKMEQWAGQNFTGDNKTYQSMIVIPEEVTSKFKDDIWLSGIKTYDWSEIENQVLPRNSGAVSGGGVKTKGKYHVAKNSRHFDLREVKDDEKIYFFNLTEASKNWNTVKISGAYGSDIPERGRIITATILNIIPDDHILLNVYANRVEKFKRDYPHAQELTEDIVYGMVVKNIEAGITDDDIKRVVSGLRFDRGHEPWYKYVPEDDPDIKWFVKDSTGFDFYDLQRKVERLPSDSEVKKKYFAMYEKADLAFKALKERYPCVYAMYNYASDELMQRYIMADYHAYKNSLNNKEEK